MFHCIAHKKALNFEVFASRTILGTIRNLTSVNGHGQESPAAFRNQLKAKPFFLIQGEFLANYHVQRDIWGPMVLQLLV